MIPLLQSRPSPPTLLHNHRVPGMVGEKLGATGSGRLAWQQEGGNMSVRGTFLPQFLLSSLPWLQC